MYRLLGVLLGSVIATAFLIVVVGIPRFGTAPVPEPVTVQLPLTPEPPAAQALETNAEMHSVASSPGPEPADEFAAEPAIAVPVPDPETAEVAPTAAVAEAEPRSAQDPAELRWYAFWSPFRSQIAANGFVDRLQSVTGLDYRVVSVKPGVYEVAFAYANDDEIQSRLSQISAATGLDLPES